ncbi:hypothetical protein QBC44DRAFT_398070 [Cladorrhinum sp. PSN332]|nr:hypothetical protein QBC44DRAFT_398070 [Cladorrhinum sp. PSN332]
MRVAVIGAGPSGLVTLKYLITSHLFLETEPVEAVLFEAEDSIGGTFAHRTYENAELVSSKQLTTFSDFRAAPEDPDFLSTDRYVRYLNDYSTHFKLWDHIKLSTTVTSVKPKKNGGYIVTYKRKDSSKTKDYECEAVAVCSGLHVTPNIPKLKGAEKVPVVMHSSEFKRKEQLGVGKTILILGSGETAMDIGYLAMQCDTKRVVMCHRDGFLCAPKRVPDPVILPILGNKPDPTRLNVPVDSSSASLFDTAYVHRRLRDHMLLWHYYDLFIKSTLWLVGGSKYGLGQFVGGISDERYHAIFFNKSNLATPYISAPYTPSATSTLLQRIRSSLIQVPLPTPTKYIDLAPWPTHIDPAGVLHLTASPNRPEYHRLLTTQLKITPDVLIYATGYTQSFPFLPPSIPTPSSTGRGMTRSIFHPSNPSLAFIGFVRPSFGAIPPLSEQQAQLWVLALLAPHKLRVPCLRALKPQDEDHYKLKTPQNSRINYGVDHESYAYQLALDVGSALSFWEAIKAGWECRKGEGESQGGWYKLPLVWALGANFGAKFRLKGPWRWEAGAKRVMVEELWETVERRGGFLGHAMLSGLPMVLFGGISLLLWVVEPAVRLVEVLVGLLRGGGVGGRGKRS